MWALFSDLSIPNRGKARFYKTFLMYMRRVLTNTYSLPHPLTELQQTLTRPLLKIALKTHTQE